MNTRKSIKYVSTRERRDSFVEITDNETGEILKFEPEMQLGSGSYGLVRLFSHNGNKIAVKSPHKKSTQELNRKDVKEKHVDTNHEFALMQQAYPDESPFFLTQFEGKANIKEYFHDYRMIIPFFTGAKLADYFSDVAHTKDMAVLLLRVACELLRLHSIGIIHGDVSENNIIVHVDNAEITIYFIDFGLSYRITEYANLDVYDYKYLAPERLQKDPLRAHPSQDIFSLASLFNRVLSGMGEDWRAYFLNKYPVFAKFIKSSMSKDPNERETLNVFVANAFCDIFEDQLSPNQKLLITLILSHDSENIDAQITNMRAHKLHAEIIDVYLQLYQYQFYKELLFALEIDAHTFTRVTENNKYFFNTLLLSKIQNESFFASLVKIFKATTLHQYLFKLDADSNALLRAIAQQGNRSLILEILKLRLVSLPEALQTDLMTFIPSCSDEKLLLIVDIIIVINEILPKYPANHKQRLFSSVDTPQSNPSLKCAYDLLVAVIESKTETLDEDKPAIVEPHPELAILTNRVKTINLSESSQLDTQIHRPLCSII